MPTPVRDDDAATVAATSIKSSSDADISFCFFSFSEGTIKV